MSNLASLGFDADNVDPTNSFDPVPNGTYSVIIADSEMKPTKTGTGQYLQLVLEVIDGPYKGRKVWDRLNLVNSNTTAVEIAQRSLSQICHAVGIKRPMDSSELHNKPMAAKVIVKDDQQYGPGNEVKAYEPLSGGAPSPQPAAPVQPAAPQQGASVAAAPWT